MIASFIENYSRLRLRFFEWRSELEIGKKIALSIVGAMLMGALAQLKIYLPWTPVPIVGSTFGVVLAGVLLGKNWGGISTLIYVILGAFGLPWFAGFSGGIGVILGPTGGYLIGFVLSGFFIGYLIDKFQSSRKLLPLVLIMLFAHFVLMYIPGLIQLGLWMTFVKGKPFNLVELLWAGAIPFIPGDIIKSIFAAIFCNIITPKENYIAKK
ncbi:MAG: biotin transporter BioY [Brevinematales bacterium]|nr:biotin transporter BioY [Brevinematales bacterium]